MFASAAGADRCSRVGWHKVAAFYVREALAGRWNTPCVHDSRTFSALKVR